MVVQAAAAAAEAAPDGGSCRELSLLLRLGWPNSVNKLLGQLPGILMLAFLGSDGDALAAAGMAFMFANVSGTSVVIGSGAGAGTLISQAFGAGNFKRCGDVLQRQIAIHMLLIVFIAALWWFTEPFLLMLHQPPTVSKLTAQFVRWRIPGLPFLILREDLANYLVAQRAMVPPMIISCVVHVLQILAFPVLIGRFGFVGAPLAFTGANALQALCLMLVAWRALPNKQTWPKWSLSTALQGWGEVLGMSLPAGVLMLSEWWGWEVNLFLAGLLCSRDAEAGGCAPLQTFPIVSNTMVVSYMFHYGFSIAAGAHVGNVLGAGDAPAARRTAHTALLLAASVVTFTTVVPLLLLRWHWGRLFTNDAEVAELTGQVLPLVCIYIFLDALGPSALLNLLRGMGVVKLPAVINVVSFYAIGIPTGLLLTFGQGEDGWGIFGLWVGLDLAMFTMVTCLFLFLFCWVDWKQAIALPQPVMLLARAMRASSWRMPATARQAR